MTTSIDLRLERFIDHSAYAGDTPKKRAPLSIESDASRLNALVLTERKQAQMNIAASTMNEQDRAMLRASRKRTSTVVASKDKTLSYAEPTHIPTTPHIARVNVSATLAKVQAKLAAIHARSEYEQNTYGTMPLQSPCPTNNESEPTVNYNVLPTTLQHQTIIVRDAYIDTHQRAIVRQVYAIAEKQTYSSMAGASVIEHLTLVSGYVTLNGQALKVNGFYRNGDTTSLTWYPVYIGKHTYRMAFYPAERRAAKRASWGL